MYVIYRHHMTLDFKFKWSVTYCVNVAAVSSLFALSLSIFLQTFHFDQQQYNSRHTLAQVSGKLRQQSDRGAPTTRPTSVRVEGRDFGGCPLNRIRRIKCKDYDRKRPREESTSEDTRRRRTERWKSRFSPWKRCPWDWRAAPWAAAEVGPQGALGSQLGWVQRAVVAVAVPAAPIVPQGLRRQAQRVSRNAHLVVAATTKYTT